MKIGNSEIQPIKVAQRITLVTLLAGALWG